ncbi:Yos1-like protein [Vararia minispora EC-137]|uniref:Yos1-like protein n=1 Tax=Vararia minispora EC-137 TaxID=1314806 RepID=A0ACB8QXY6_9AGAM|nr:Yos1-like protein [Vararia minispora EC-137]
MFYGFGSIIYFAILIVNAIAVLSEDRFLARIGWSSVPQPAANAGFGNDVYGQQDIGVKARIINLISAVRTLMRIPLIGINLLIIVFEILRP